MIRTVLLLFFIIFFSYPSYADSEVYHYDMANKYYIGGEIEKSITECLEALKINPAYGPAYNGLGVCYYAM
ncbi:MAG TPA: tetratricopeptide repeat protein, partial [Candidatus Eremiobacteraeota bacterium]|nr:tetratricopeptide repeat protein [Candidatus Eremiobacteraeota bacterium]